jgi:hypothetical protein
MSSQWTQRLLLIYSGVVTVALVGVVITEYAGSARKMRFDEIDVQRINVIEPDGQIRLVVSDRARFPGSFYGGKEIKRPDRQATGLLFMDDEGTEMGGLIFGGAKNKNGQVSQNGHLSFDQYDQDQIFSLDAGQDGATKRTMLVISDRGDYPLHESFDELLSMKTLPSEQRQAAMKRFLETHPGDHPRVQLGRAADKSVALRMEDADGHDRIVMRVNADGTPVLQFLDESGSVVDELPRSQTRRR